MVKDSEKLFHLRSSYQMVERGCCVQKNHTGTEYGTTDDMQAIAVQR